MAVERRLDGSTRGGNEPPDELQDTIEQNAGYDKAVRGEFVSPPVDAEDALPESPPVDSHERDREKTTLSDLPQGHHAPDQQPKKRRRGKA
jgi:hypothetical protein